MTAPAAAQVRTCLSGEELTEGTLGGDTQPGGKHHPLSRPRLHFLRYLDLTSSALDFTSPFLP